MNRHLVALVLSLLLCVVGVTQADVYDDVFWGGGDGDWTGVHTNNGDPNDYQVGNWIAPDGTPNLPAAQVFGRRDGVRVGEVDAGIGGVQLGTDIYIDNGATVTYNPNRHLFYPNSSPERFGDWRIQPDAAFPGTPTVNLSNGSVLQMTTTLGGDPDGMWTRWNGAELNIDNATFRRLGDSASGFSGGAFMLASYHGYEDSVQTVSLTNGGRLENQGQLWFGISGDGLGEESEPGISVVMTINDGHLDLTGGDEYGLDNDALLLRADLAFVYGWTSNDDPEDPDTLLDNETFIINFTGPGTITVDGEHPNPLDGPVDPGEARGGIRVAMQTGNLIQVGDDMVAEYVGRNEQASYEDLWDLGILRANNMSGLDGADFNDSFMVTNNPGDTDYMLTSLVEPPTGVPGDYNGNGTVDAADYVLWRNGGPLMNEFDNPGTVDEADYAAWRERFGNSTPPGSGSIAAVPEPGAMLLMLVGLTSFLALKLRAR